MDRVLATVMVCAILGAIFGGALLVGLRNPGLIRRIPDWGWRAITVYCCLVLVLLIVYWFVSLR